MVDTPSTVTRRRVLQAGAAGSALLLAGCNSGGSSKPLTFEEILGEYELKGARKVLLPGNTQSSLGVETGQQVRVSRARQEVEQDDGSTVSVAAGRPAVYTVREGISESFPNQSVVLSERNLQRVDAEFGDPAQVRNTIPNPDLTTRRAAEQNNELIERLIDDGRGYVCALAPNGGDTALNTMQQAARLASTLGLTAWGTTAFDEDGPEGARERWYVPTTELTPEAYPKLDEIYGRSFDYTVSFEGAFDKTIDGDIRIGGLLSESDRIHIKDGIVQQFAGAGESADVRVAPTGSAAATQSSSLANRMTRDDRSGIELVQSDRVRNEHWALVADGVTNAIRELLSREYSRWE
jgi:hypothetical protein